LVWVYTPGAKAALVFWAHDIVRLSVRGPLPQRFEGVKRRLINSLFGVISDLGRPLGSACGQGVGCGERENRAIACLAGYAEGL
jgi:hypothetical protein